MRVAALDRLRAQTASAGCRGLIVLNPINLRYLTGYHSNAYSRPLSLLLPVEGEPILVVPRLEADQARALTAVSDVRDYVEWDSVDARAGGGLDDEWLAALAEALRDRKLSSSALAVETAALAGPRAGHLAQALGEQVQVQVADASGWVEALRLIKSPEEIEHHRQAAALAAVGLDAALETARDHLSEREIWAAAAAAMLRQAALQWPDTPVAVGGNAIVGARTAMLHSPATGARPEPGDLVFVVVVASVAGSWCELSRTIALPGASASRKQLGQMFQAVQRAHAAALAEVRPGATGQAVDRAARRALGLGDDDGLARFQPMRTGHGLGFSGGAEAPNLGVADATPLAAGMVISIEPSVCIPGVGGVCWADNYAVTEDGVDRLSDYPVEVQEK